MMNHPFDGIIEPAGELQDHPSGEDHESGRREMLRGVVLAGGGAVLGMAAKASGAKVTTLAIGEEGGGSRPRRPTTKRRGEEGGGSKRPPMGEWGDIDIREPKSGKDNPALQKRIAAGIKEAQKLLTDGKWAKSYDKLEAVARLPMRANVRKQFKATVPKLDKAAADALAQADKQFKGGEQAEAVRTYSSPLKKWHGRESPCVARPSWPCRSFVSRARMALGHTGKTCLPAGGCPCHEKQPLSTG